MKNHDFPKCSIAHKSFVFKDRGMLLGNLIHIQVFFEENFEKWSKNYLNLKIKVGGKSAPPPGHLFVQKGPVLIGLKGNFIKNKM